jgi:two-component system response regulator (stage 0 sporulation protein A)
MNIEEKLNAIINYLLAETEEEHNKAAAVLSGMRDSGTSTQNVEDEISSILLELGIPEHIKGHGYAVYAIKIAVADPELLGSFTKELYPAVAKKFNTTGSRVERAIRHGIDCAWSRLDCEISEKYFGSTISATKGRPTNSEFIARIVHIVRRRMRNG